MSPTQPEADALVPTRNRPDDAPRRKRGFAALDPMILRSISSKGGSSVPAAKRSFARNPDLATEAGRKGGERVPGTKRSFTQDRELAASAGRKGGERRHKPA